MTAGQNVTVTGVSPSGYNGTWTIVSTTASTIVVTLVSNPGAYTSGGSAEGNLNYNPVGDGNVHWQLLTPAWFVTPRGQTGGFVATVGTEIAGRMSDISNVGATFPAITSYEMGLDFNDTGPNALQNILYNEVTVDARMQAHYNNYYFPAFAAAGQTGIMTHYSSVGNTTDNGLYPFRQGVYGTVLGKELGIIQFIQANPKASLP